MGNPNLTFNTYHQISKIRPYRLEDQGTSLHFYSECILNCCFNRTINERYMSDSQLKYVTTESFIMSKTYGPTFSQYSLKME